MIPYPWVEVFKSLITPLIRWTFPILFISFMSGCTIVLKGEGEVGFRQSTHWGFYHRVIQDNEMESSANIDSPPLVEWVLGDEQNDKTESATTS